MSTQFEWAPGLRGVEGPGFEGPTMARYLGKVGRGMLIWPSSLLSQRRWLWVSDPEPGDSESSLAVTVTELEGA